MDLGTGAVKITPAHDPNDYAGGRRHKLPMINILNPDGTLNEQAGEFQGMRSVQGPRSDRRKDAVARAPGERRGAEIPLAHSDRSKTPIEPLLSDQWFVRMQDLANAAMDAVEDRRVRFFPGRYAKTYLDWLGEKRDWRISRQFWWGHHIPDLVLRHLHRSGSEESLRRASDVCLAAR